MWWAPSDWANSAWSFSGSLMQVSSSEWRNEAQSSNEGDMLGFVMVCCGLDDYGSMLETWNESIMWQSTVITSLFFVPTQQWHVWIVKQSIRLTSLSNTAAPGTRHPDPANNLSWAMLLTRVINAVLMSVIGVTDFSRSFRNFNRDSLCPCDKRCMGLGLSWVQPKKARRQTESRDVWMRRSTKNNIEINSNIH